MYIFIGLLTYFDSEAFAQTNERKSALGLSLGPEDRDDEGCEDVENDQAEDAGSAAGPEPEWASNKYTFCKVLQLNFRKSCFHKDLRVQNACIFASFRKYALEEILRFRKLLQL